MYFCCRSPGARTSTTSGASGPASRSAASGALMRSVVAVSSGRDARLSSPSFEVPDDVVEADAAETRRRPRARVPGSR